MASGRLKPSTKKAQRQAQASQPRGVEKRLQRPPRRSARLAKARDAKTTDGKPRHPLPSPPTSYGRSKEVRLPSTVPYFVLKVHQTKTQPPSTSSPKPSAARASQPLQESDASQRLEPKRKRSQEDYELASPTGHKPTGKRARTSPPACPGRNEGAASGPNRHEDDRVRRWIETVTRSELSSDNDPNMSRPLNKKRSSSSMSYTQGVKEGLNPPQYTPGYEEVLQDAGIYMNEELGQAISDTSQELCEVLLNSFFPPPSNSLFGGQPFLLTLDEVRNENEPRVQRDITPLLVPCASLLYLHDRIVQCRHLSAKIQSEWTKVTPLAGPLPTPDYVVGLKRSAFTRDEILELQAYSAPNRATIFRDGLYFPFLVCEVSTDSPQRVIQTYDFLKVKCGENGLSIAERQSMHVASVAANAIVELFRDRAVSRAEELHRKILVFSISHNHTTVKIHGHYSCIDRDKTTFHRHLIRDFSLRDRNGEEKWTTHHIIRKIYDYFVPIHLERIRGAIAKLSIGSSFGLSSASLESNPGADRETESDSQEMAEGAPSSHGTERAKKARLKPTAMLQQENDYLKKQNELLMRQSMPPPSNVTTTESELVKMLQQQNAQMKERMDRQTEQMDTQREQMVTQREENQGLKEEMSKLTQSVLALAAQSQSTQPEGRAEK
ncbi:MAG: hypothetical protein L6R35_001177 [Caloplaca aegaea]|nr:MAG: hypothetical protein L6R35_001177 [Caloplaca aegaea]